MSRALGWLLAVVPVIVAGTACESAEAVPGGTTVAIIGDSITSGTKYGGRGDKSWASVAAECVKQKFPFVTFRVSGQGGSGYHWAGTNGTTFVSEAQRIIRHNTAVVVFFGSVNDTHDLGPLRPAIDRAITTARLLAPSASVVTVSPTWTRNAPVDGRVDVVRADIRAEALDRGVRYVDPIGDGWFADRTGMVGGDGVHPTDRAHAVIADHLCPIIENELAGTNR